MTRIPLLTALLLSLSLLAGCPGDDDDSATDDDDAGDDDAGDDDAGGPVEFAFTIGVIADPHITGNAEHAARLDAAIGWLNEQTDARSIEMVVVLGDIGWGNGLPGVKDQLDTLAVPYVPITGDNETHVVGGEELFYDTFTPQWELLATEFDSFSRAPMPVANPEIGDDSWFTIFSLDHKGVHVVGMDWCVRGDDGLVSEFGDLHDFDGGSYRWLEDDLAGRVTDPDDSILILSHIPMHLGMFDLEEMDDLEVLFHSLDGAFYANLAGHVHIDAYYMVGDDLYEVYVYDATWDDEVTVGLVEVSGNDQRFEYTHELHVVPFGD